MQEYTAVIIGGGPAGAALGYKLVENGIKCCIIDKAFFPREKLCGGLITKKTYDLYRAIFKENISCVLRETDEVGIYYHYEKVNSVKTATSFYLVERTDFDMRLINLFKSIGGELKEGKKVTSIDPDNSTILLSSGETIQYQYLIGADGANSTIRTMMGISYKPNGIGLEVNDLPGSGSSEIQLHLNAFPHGYGWVFPKKHSLTVGIGGILYKTKNLKSNLLSFMQNIGYQAEMGNELKGAYIPYGSYVRNPVKGNVFLVGDAAGLVDPTTGEGIYYALLSGAMLGNFIVSGGDVGSSYRKALKKIHSQIKNSRFMRNLFFHPSFLPRAIKGLRKYPSAITYTCDHAISEYHVSLSCLIFSYYLDRIKRKFNGALD